MYPLRLLFPALFLFLAALLISACSDEGNGDATDVIEVKVGVVQSLSGAAAIYGSSVVKGIELAVSEINETDSALQISIVTVDDESTVEGGRQAFQSLLDQNVAAILGPTLSNVALQDLQLAQDAGIPVLGVTTTAQGVTEIGDYIFRVALTEAVVVPAAIARVNQDTPIERAVLIYDSSDAFSRSSADAMRSGIGAIEAEMALEVDVTQTEIRQALAGLDGESFDAFLVTPLVDESVAILEAIRSAGYDQIVIGGNSFNTLSIADASGDAVEGAYVGAAWNPAVESEASRRFVAAFTVQYGTAPDLFAAQGYSAVYLLRAALLKAATTDAEALRDALAALSGVETPLGNITMSEDREVVHAPVIQRFESGRLVALP